MYADQIKSLISRRVSLFLKESRQQAGLSVEKAAARLGYGSAQRLKQYEEGASIPCNELVRLVEKYPLSEESLTDFLIDLQVEVYKLRSR